MPETPADPLVESLVNDFGANYVFALDLLEEYRRDRASVEPSWGQYFDRLLGVAAPPPAPVTGGRASRPPAEAPARTDDARAIAGRDARRRGARNR